MGVGAMGIVGCSSSQGHAAGDGSAVEADGRGRTVGGWEEGGKEGEEKV